MAMGPLVKALENDDGGLQCKVLQVLGALADARSLQAIAGLTSSRDPAVRACACRALGPMNDERAIAPLIDRLGDADEFVRKAAAQSLAQQGLPALPPLAARYATAYRKMLDAKHRIDQANQRGHFDFALIDQSRACSSEFVHVHESLIAVAAVLGPEQARNLLGRLFADRTVRDADLAVVERIGPKAREPLEQLLRAPGKDVRLRAIQALGALRDPRSIRVLEPLLAGGDPEARDLAAAALREIARASAGEEAKAVVTTAACEFCGTALQPGSKYCPGCGALNFDEGLLSS